MTGFVLDTAMEFTFAALITWAMSLALVTLTSGQDAVYECPHEWYTNRGFCYLFELSNPATHDEATSRCQAHGSGLVNVVDEAEHLFITRWLERRDPFRQEWYTSAIIGASDRPSSLVFAWQSSGMTVTSFSNTTWLEPPIKGQGSTIVYARGDSRWGWKQDDPYTKRLYICKIDAKEAYRVHNTDRDFGYGISERDPNLWEKGPQFIIQPNSIVILSEGGTSAQSAILECSVIAKPEATYKWFKGRNLEQEITAETDARYSITNGRLEIREPNDQKDATFYRCMAENKFGKVLSRAVEISFGSMGQFSNVKSSGTRVNSYEGAKVECSPITYTPAISYQWLKASTMRFVRPKYQTYIFISNYGRLYFSEVTRNDEEEYKCIAALKGTDENTIGGDQPPMRTSLPIPLIVRDQAPKAVWGPVIQDEFIAVFPNPPVKGSNVRLECFAYGSVTSPFSYTWTREDQPMPSNAQMYDHNRILLIRNAQLENSGTYRCTVSRGGAARDSKAVSLVLSSRPYFVRPLRTQHVDVGSQLTWICGARGNPEPSYRWYKNGRLLTSNPTERIKIQSNVLTISDLEGKLHNGMYQCEASNNMGNSFSTGQLRVLSVPPSFHKQKVRSEIMGAEEGNATLLCQPEGAPFPDIQWFFNGGQINNDGTKRIMMGDGNLVITSLTRSDVGTYRCTATNIFGTANVTSVLDVTEGATITVPPRDDTVVVNSTQFLDCHASFPGNIDTIYEWTFYDYPIDRRGGHFSLSNEQENGKSGLYVINAQYKHEGVYICTARTPFNKVSASAYLTVLGPPKRAAGIIFVPDSVTHNTAGIMWTAPGRATDDVTHYVIQTANEFEPEVYRDAKTMTSAQTSVLDGVSRQKHTATIDTLNPGTSYKFRVIGVNAYGRGIPSDPSAYVRTASAAPVVSPKHVRGGGGSVGDLTIRWEPLHRSEYGASTLRYMVYWRDSDKRNGLFRHREIKDPQGDFTVVLVGPLKYYLPYDVKVQAFNVMGYGPNSSVVTVMSAEELPVVTPTKVATDTYNSTAISVVWIPLEDTRDVVRGKIKGYQINYWQEDEDPLDYLQFIRYYGQTDGGLVIGLDVDVNYVMDVQVFNSAGLGPRSNKYIMETSGFAPLHYPQEVHISSAGPNRARVWWRGISITTSEEALEGYALWVWVASESPGSARLIETGSLVFQYIIDDIEESRLYALRIGAIGGGGYGKKTPTMYFTMEGQLFLDSVFAQSVDSFVAKGTSLQTTGVCFIVTILSTIMSVL